MEERVKTGRPSSGRGPVFRFRFVLLAVAALLLPVLAGGCTERERAGYSSIPQNSPSPWSMQPYGDLRN